MSAADVKAAVREYADEEFPGWASAGIVIRTSTGEQIAVEELLVIPDSPLPSLQPRTFPS
jgi:hypothetical protein